MIHSSKPWCFLWSFSLEIHFHCATRYRRLGAQRGAAAAAFAAALAGGAAGGASALRGVGVSAAAGGGAVGPKGETTGGWDGNGLEKWRFSGVHQSILICFSPPARWGLLDFMSVAWSSSSSPLLLLSLSSSSRCPPPLVVLLVLLLNCDSRSTVFSIGPQPRPSTPSVPCRTLTTTIHAQCSLPDLNREYPRPVFPAGPQPRPSPPSVPCRTSTTTIHAQCSLPDLNREYPRQVFPAGPHVGR